MSKTGILIIQLGSPKTSDVKDVKKYLNIFLTDPRLIDNVRRPIWKALLKFIILPIRSPKTAAAYKKIWRKDGVSPLYHNTQSFTDKLSELHQEFIFTCAYSYSDPTIEQGYKKLLDQGCTHIKAIPMYPQYCEATTMSCWDSIQRAKKEYGEISVDFLYDYHDNPAYIQSITKNLTDALKEFPNCEKILFSYHGYPIRRVRNGDKYLKHCLNSTALILKETKLTQDKIKICFQSQFGRELWLQPQTEQVFKDFLKQGIKNIIIIAPGFAIDNLETLEELNISLREIFEEMGGEKLVVVPCLNEQEQWVKQFSKEIITSDAPIQENISRIKNKEKTQQLPEAIQPCCVAKQECPGCPATGKMTTSDGRISVKAKKILRLVFFILFLDLISFSIIFPLFPSILEYYREVEGSTGLFHNILEYITGFTGGIENNRLATTALFGGVLIFFYSLLQFIVSPFFGTLSDHFGRKPIIVFSMFGLALSYLLWGFADTFLLLVISRLLAGLMGSNITTTTAIISDITDTKNRSKAMAIVGIAFGLGFIVGPMLGAIFSLIDLSSINPLFNPCSFVAFFAFTLTLINSLYLVKKLPETLTKKKKSGTRTINIFKLFSVEKYPGVSRTNLGYFIFLIAFAGAETFLTFLTFERLEYGAINNGLMFLFIGLVLAFSQGAYVRRKIKTKGEKYFIIRGLLYQVIAFAIISISYNSFFLFLGLFFMSLGAAYVLPSLTSLVSLYTPMDEQGRVLGIFRSLGALSRTIGPLIGAIAYWKLNSQGPYLIAIIFVVLSFIIVTKLPPIPKQEN